MPLMSDAEIIAHNSHGADESEEQWLRRLKLAKAGQMIQDRIDDGTLVRLPGGRLTERDKIE